MNENRINALLSKVVTPEKHAELRRELAVSGPVLRLQADAVVIGSGAGGSVAAAELSAAGWKVVLIEEGGFFDINDFSNNEFQSLARMYRDGGVISEEEGRVAILQGRTLGGSTTVNWQASLYPPDYVTEEWNDHFGLTGYKADDMQEYIEAVHRRLAVHDVPDRQVNENNQVIFRGARKKGIPSLRLQNNSRNCLGLGRCGLGCPIRAKQSTYLTYIPDAIEAGATVITNMRAIHIRDGKVKKVTAEFSPDLDKAHSPDVFLKLEIKAKVVISSAGAIETPALLLRSGLGNRFVGKHLKIHPTLTIFARFPGQIHMFSGVPQSAVIKHGHHQEGGYGFWLEAAPYRPTLASSLIPFFGHEQWKLVKDYAHLQAGIVLVRDGADGPVDSSVEWSFSRRKVYYKLGNGDAINLLRGLKMLAEIQAAAGATELVMPFRRLHTPIPVNANSDFSWILNENSDNFFSVGSAHPHGSVQAAADPKRGAVDGAFQLYGHNNIYVMDASVFPTGLSVNPQITTMAVCMRAARALARKQI